MLEDLGSLSGGRAGRPRLPAEQRAAPGGRTWTWLRPWTWISGLGWASSRGDKTALITLQVVGEGLHNVRQVQVRAVCAGPTTQGSGLGGQGLCGQQLRPWTWISSLGWASSRGDKAALISRRLSVRGVQDARQVQMLRPECMPGVWQPGEEMQWIHHIPGQVGCSCPGPPRVVASLR